MNQSLINSLCYSVGWFWCVLLGIEGKASLAFSGALFLVLFQLHSVKKNTDLYVQDLILAIFSIPLGFFLEMLFIKTNLLHYVNSNHKIPPIWILSLYPLFTLQLNHSLKILKKNDLASFVFGFLGAPLSYMAGLSLGAVFFSLPLLQTYLIIGICWGFFLCFLTKIGRMIEKATRETLADCDSKNQIKLLYDGECPICKREICYLQKKDDRNKIQFVDISSNEFSANDHNNIDYKTAMSQIHAIEGKSKLLVGIPAFAAIYARCGMFVISTLFRIPFIKLILEACYEVFAKNRLWLTRRKDDN